MIHRISTFKLLIIGILIFTSCEKSIEDKRLYGVWVGNAKESLSIESQKDDSESTILNKLIKNSKIIITRKYFISDNRKYKYRIVKVDKTYCILYIDDGVKHKDGTEIQHRVDFVQNGIWISQPSMENTYKVKYDRVK